MDSSRLRLFYFIGLLFVSYTLFNEWELAKNQSLKPDLNTAHSSTQVSSDIPASVKISSDIPKVSTLPEDITEAQELIWIHTDVISLAIDLRGGDIVKAYLKDYPQTLEAGSEPFVLLDQSDARYSIAQSGFLSELGPDSPTAGRAHYTSDRKSYKISAVDNVVSLFWENTDAGHFVEKRYTLSPQDYTISVSYHLRNEGDTSWQGKLYNQIKRKPLTVKKTGMIGMQMYQGGAYFSGDKPYNKIPYDKMKAKPLSEGVEGGWIAMMEHYFLTAWVPDQNAHHTLFSRGDSEEYYYLGSMDSPVSVHPGDSKVLQSTLYLGPEKPDLLKTLSPGLELTVDYGILWPIAQPIFWVLKQLHAWVMNWGAAIILVTVLLKLLFYKLSAASYRSMGNMRRLQPRIEQLKRECGEDRKKFSESMMRLYQKEKVNPFGGCLPILVQLPVFIALYYVLMESVELRQAPFFLWIQDLSAKDPYYVLPLLMGASMLIQQRLNPAPPDPMQAKVMMFMPILFTILFLQFPAGLVLYWVVNNSLSILQQWWITRQLLREPDRD